MAIKGHALERKISEIKSTYRKSLRMGVARFLALAGKYPDAGKIWLEIGLLYDRRGREAEAIPFYEKALKLGMSQDDRRSCLICLGSSLRTVGKLQEARKTFQRAAKADPGCIAPEMFMALVLCDLGEHQRAVKLLAGLLLKADEAQELDGFRSALTKKFKALQRKRTSAN